MDAEHALAAPLLVRWASPDAQHAVAAVLRDAGADPAEVAGLVRRRGVLVLSDLTLPPSAPLLRAEGVDRVQAWAGERSAGASLLVDAGFTVGGYTAHGAGSSRLWLWL